MQCLKFIYFFLPLKYSFKNKFLAKRSPISHSNVVVLLVFYSFYNVAASYRQLLICSRGSSQSSPRIRTSKKTTTRTSLRRRAPSFGNCSECQRRRSWSTITPAATGRGRFPGRDGFTSASTTSASIHTYWEKKVHFLSLLVPHSLRPKYQMYFNFLHVRLNLSLSH